MLALLVACSLILLSAYFGRSRGGPLRSVQHGVVEVFAPVQDAAARALKPARDLVGWVGDLRHAKRDADRLRRENAQLRREAVGAAQDRFEAARLQALVKLDEAADLGAYRPLGARVTFRSPIVWAATVQIARGSADGVREDQPVVDGDGLVGRVTDVTPNAAQVTLITDESSGVSAHVLTGGRGRSAGDVVPGVVQPAVGRPQDLLLTDLQSTRGLRVGQSVVTSGTTSTRLESLFPPGIPIGRVARLSDSEAGAFGRVHLEPYVDFRRLSFVQVLTRPRGAAGERAALP